MGTMYDSTTPLAIPAGADYIAIYYNGLYAASRDIIKRHYPRARIFTIDVLNEAPEACGIADVETGDMTPGDVPGWVTRRLAAHPGVLCRIYCNKSTWPDVKTQVASLDTEKRQQVRYWIADPTGHPHLVPGSDATQYAWDQHYDVSHIDVTRFA